MMFRNWLQRDTMSCSDVLAVLQAYIDGEVTTSQARRVVRHLGACIPCEGQRKLYARIKQGVRRRPEAVDPDILAALRNYGQSLTSGTGGSAASPHDQPPPE